MKNWKTLTGVGVPCPVVFDAEDVRQTMNLDEVQKRTDAVGGVPEHHRPRAGGYGYEEAMALGKQTKANALAE